MRQYLYIIIYALLTALVTACSQDELDVPSITSEQQALIGRAVNFNVSVAAQFATRATSYTTNDAGAFNQNDRMRIYRNYMGINGQWEQTDVYRTYYLNHKYAAGGIYLGVDWLPEAGRRGYDDKDEDGVYETFVQTADDSLTWENGRTLRFRAWSQSNFSNILRNATKDYFYPDFCIATWVNASGPTEGIPLVLNHQGSRIVFKTLQGGNQIKKVELCWEDWEDYKYRDNADSTYKDNSASEAGKTDEMAQKERDSVAAVYRRMCMPAGVNINNGTLKAVKAANWQQLTPDQVRRLEEQDESIFIPYGSLTADEIATQAQRPFFCGINSSFYLITIPYDMSTGEQQGDVLSLPACTRFRVYLYDVNNGDEAQTPGYEGAYHIFRLKDIMEISGKDTIPAFPNGLKMAPGVSYTFKVGYRYNSLAVVVDKSLSWVDQDKAELEGRDEAVGRPESTTKNYSWWKTAIRTAANTAVTSSSDYKPEFHIGSEQDFLELIRLVNGTAATKTDGLYRLVKTYKTTVVGGQEIRVPETYGWSTTNSVYNPVWIEESEAEELGYLFYDRYYPANADQAARVERDYLKGPFSFYNENLRLNFKVVLDCDLDLKDWQLESIGNVASNPFMGKFDGGGHTLCNLNMKDEYLFGYMDGKAPGGASVTNLKIESTHPTALLRKGVNPIYLAGISLLASSSGSSIAGSLTMEAGTTGTSYVVGCIHVGEAGGALVGEAERVNMFGCMQAARGITGGALIGTDLDGLIKPQIKMSKQKSNPKLAVKKPAFSNFMCNFYDTELSPGAVAVGGATDDYSLLEYIRGRQTDILRAKNDYLTTGVPMQTLILLANYQDYYGLAPWHAMNYAIWWYNANRGSNHPCTMQFRANDVGYKHQYPTLVSGQLTAEQVKAWNPVEQPN